MATSDHCRYHPDRPAIVNCQKHGMGLCESCLDQDPHCPDPEIYCKFRPQCVIFFRRKELKRAANHGDEA